MFDDLYYLEWDWVIYAMAGLLLMFLMYSMTENFVNSLITTVAVVVTAYVILNHVM